MDTAGLIKLLNVVALVVLMLSIGLTVQPVQVLAAARQVRLVLRGVLANFVLTPLVTVGLLYAFDAVPLVAAGFLILAVCPGAPVGPTFTGIARGDVAAATGLMVILAGSSALLTPLLLTVLLGWFAPDSDLRIDIAAITVTLLVSQLVPLAVGLALHQTVPRWSARAARPFRLTANLLLLVVVALILASQYQTLGAIRPRGWFGMVLLLAASLGIGWLCGGPSPAPRRALAVTTGVRNAAVGLVIAGDNFAGTPAVTAVIAYALVSIFGTLGCAFLFARSAADSVPATAGGKEP